MKEQTQKAWIRTDFYTKSEKEREESFVLHHMLANHYRKMILDIEEYCNMRIQDWGEDEVSVTVLDCINQRGDWRR